MDNLKSIAIHHTPVSKPEYFIAGRQQGKTSEALARLREHPDGVILVGSAGERRRLEEENPDLKGRIVHNEDAIRGRKISYLIVDEGDLNTTDVAGVPVDFVTISLKSPTITYKPQESFFDTLADYIPPYTTNTTTGNLYSHEYDWGGPTVQQYYHVPAEAQAIDNTPIDYTLEDIADEEDF